MSSQQQQQQQQQQQKQQQQQRHHRIHRRNQRSKAQQQDTTATSMADCRRSLGCAGVRVCGGSGGTASSQEVASSDSGDNSSRSSNGTPFSAATSGAASPQPQQQLQDPPASNRTNANVISSEDPPAAYDGSAATDDDAAGMKRKTPLPTRSILDILQEFPISKLDVVAARREAKTTNATTASKDKDGNIENEEDDDEDDEYTDQFIAKFEEEFYAFLKEHPDLIPVGERERRIMKLQETALALEESKTNVEEEFKKQAEHLLSSRQMIEQTSANDMQLAVDRQRDTHRELSKILDTVALAVVLQQQTTPFLHFLKELDEHVEDEAPQNSNFAKHPLTHKDDKKKKQHHNKSLSSSTTTTTATSTTPSSSSDSGNKSAPEASLVAGASNQSDGQRQRGNSDSHSAVGIPRSDPCAGSGRPSARAFYLTDQNPPTSTAAAASAASTISDAVASGAGVVGGLLKVGSGGSSSFLSGSSPPQPQKRQQPPSSDVLLRALRMDHALLSTHISVLNKEIERHEAMIQSQEQVGRFLTEHNVWGILKGTTGSTSSTTTTISSSVVVVDDHGGDGGGNRSHDISDKATAGSRSSAQPTRSDK